MQATLDEIEHCVGSGRYYAAISLALTVPDIAAALGSSNGESKPARYKAWFDANLSPKYPNLTAHDCYCLRCGVVHQGRFGHPGSQYDRVLFTIPTPEGRVFHNNIFNDALNLDAPTFCRDIVKAALKWLKAEAGNATVQTNLQRSVRLYPRGLAPYMVGTPLIA